MKKSIVLLLMVVSMYLLVGCKSGSDTDNNASKSNNSTEVNSNETINNTTDEKINDQEDQTEDNSVNEIDHVEIEERVIASSVAVVEILDALNVPMVGVPTSSYELPSSVKDATRVGSPMAPDMEIISSLNPTVVVSVDTLSEELKTQFENLKISSEFMNLSSYDGLKDSIQRMGDRFKAKDKADAIIADLEEKEREVNSRLEGKESPSVLIVFGVSNSFMVATEQTYIGDLVRRAGGQNILSGHEGSFIPVDMEFLADKNPEFILFMAHANPEESLAAFKKEFETNKAWQNFDAVVNDKTIALETGYFGMSANLLVGDAMLKLVDLLY